MLAVYGPLLPIKISIVTLKTPSEINTLHEKWWDRYYDNVPYELSSFKISPFIMSPIQNVPDLKCPHDEISLLIMSPIQNVPIYTVQGGPR